MSTCLGSVAFARPYCVCDHCGFACAPLDYGLGIPAQGPTTVRRELVTHAATISRSLEKAQSTLVKQSRIKLSVEGVRPGAKRQGRRVVEETRARAHACFENQGRVPDAPSKSFPLLVITRDGRRVQTRAENRQERWKEGRAGCVYDAVPHPDPPARTAENYTGAQARAKTYTPTMVSWEHLGLTGGKSWDTIYREFVLGCCVLLQRQSRLRQVQTAFGSTSRG